MKKTLTCFLISLISFAYSYETVEHFSKIIFDNSIILIDDFNTEENSESERSNEKSEKLDFSDDTFLSNKHHNALIADNIVIGNRGSRQNNIFSSSDHSREIYSPPKAL